MCSIAWNGRDGDSWHLSSWILLKMQSSLLLQWIRFEHGTVAITGASDDHLHCILSWLKAVFWCSYWCWRIFCSGWKMKMNIFARTFHLIWYMEMPLNFWGWYQCSASFHSHFWFFVAMESYCSSCLLS